MVSDFYSDLEQAREAEQIVLDTFAAMSDKYDFIPVGSNPAYYYKGDILAIGEDGREIGIEVKDDSRIAETYNILCEEEVYYKSCDYYGKGNMSSNYDVYCIVSRQEKKIYVIDFSILKANYRKGEFKEIKHPQQITYCYLLNIGQIKSLGGLIATVHYKNDVALVA